MRHHIVTTTLLVLSSFSASGARAEAARGQLATSFEANRGQLPADVRFTHRSRDFDLEVLSSGAIRVSTSGWTGTIAFGPSAVDAPDRVVGTDPRAGTVSVFVGADPAGWVTGIPLFGGVLVRGIDHGVDLALSADGRRVALDFLAVPGSDPSLLRWTINGTDRGVVESDLVVPLDGGQLRLPKPVALSDDASRGSMLSTVIEVAPSDAMNNPGESTDVRLAIERDGGAYIAGSVDRGRGFDDVFVARLDPDRSSLAWVAYLGGAGPSRLSGIVVDAAGQPVLAGHTLAPDFPLARPVQAAAGGGRDAFVVRLADDGSSLTFSTLLGGKGADAAEGIALAPDGTIRVAGSTSSGDLPFRAVDAGDAFVATIDTGGARVVSTATIDRGGIESARAIAIDRQGIAYIAGDSRQLDRSHAFVAKLAGEDRDGFRVSPIGEGHDGAATALTIDGLGRVWIAGWFTAADLGPGDDRLPLVAECAPDGSTRVIPHAAGTGTASAAVAIAFDPAGTAWLAEETEGGVRVSRWASDDVSSREVVSYLAGVERAGGIALAQDGSVLVAGSTRDVGIANIVGPIASNADAVLTAIGGGSRSPSAAGCPGTINFDNSAGTGLWQTTTNWDLDRLPNSADDVCIGPGFAVNLSSGAQTIGSLFVGASSSLAVTGGSLSIAADSQVDGSLTLQAGTISGTGDITVSGLTTWTAGGMTGAGTTITNGGLSLSGAATKDLSGSRVLNATGNTTWTGSGGMRVGSSAAIHNTGIWDCQNDASIALLSIPAIFYNDAPGVFRKSAGAGTTTLGIAFDNASSVEVQTGTLSLNAGGLQNGSFAGSPGATLRFGGGTHTLGATSSVNAETVLFASGIVNLSGTYLATDVTTVSGATVTFNAASTITGIGSPLTISGGTVNFSSGDPIDTTALNFSGGSLGGTDTITVSGLTTWTGGGMTGAGTTNTDGGLSMSGSGLKDLSSSRVLNATGNTTWTGSGGMRVGSSAAIHNTGIWDCQNDASIALLSIPAIFYNDAPGVFRKSAGAGTTTLGIAFDNASSVEVQTGTLSLNAGGLQNGSFAGSPGATLRFGGGTHTLGATSSVNAETVLFASGIVNLSGTYLATDVTTVSGATVTFNAASTITGIGSPLTISGGTVNFSSGDPIDTTALNFSGGSLGGTDTITVSGLTTWTGGGMTGAGTTNTDGGLSMSGSGLKDLSSSRVLNATGNTTWTGSGGMRVGSSAAIHNTGIWDCQNDASIALLSIPAIFYNDAPGVFRKSAGAGTTTLGIAFDNASSVEVQTGTLSLNAGGLQNGSFAGSPGATLRFGGGTHTLGATSSVNAETVLFASGIVNLSGTYLATDVTTVSGATVTFNAASTITGIGSPLTISGGTVNFSSGDPIDTTALNFSGGSLGGTDTITVSGLTTWTGGGMTGAGTTNTDGGLSMSGSGLKDLSSSRVLNATGNTTWTGSGGMRVGSSAAIHNTGIWDCQNDASIALLSNPASFFNDAPGVFRKSAGAGTTTVGIPFTTSGFVDALSGTLSFPNGYPQTAGVTTQNGGVISSPTPLDVQGGLIRGIGTVAASVTNAGQTGPGLSPGILATAGNYTQTLAGFFAVEIGGLAAGTEHDRLAVAGAATLAGGLQVTLVNGFVPNPGNEFTILTHGSRSGTFTSSSFAPLPPGRQWRVDYFPTEVKLVVLSIPAGRVPGDLAAETALIASKSGSNMTLTWGATCVPTDTNFAVYEGVLGDFTSHVPVTCDTVGATSATFAPAAGNRYYLVNSHNEGEEGSYGYKTSGTERPVSLSACHPQNIASCP